MSTYALIVAAGRGHRSGQPGPKQYVALNGVPILRLTVDCFLSHPDIDGVLVVIHPDDETLYQQAIGGLTLLPPVFGGETRQQSVFKGLTSLVELSPDKVLIHDAARPFVSNVLISSVIAALEQADGALPALEMTDTVKQVAGDSIEGTIDRTTLRRAQTPQGFGFDKILQAHENGTSGAEATDDSALAEQAGLNVVTVPGDVANIKLTTAADFQSAQGLPKHIRVGTGFDVHRLGDGDGVTLCGVHIPHTCRLIGHSDADVALHALTDALLGAVAAGDIGRHFPPSDDKWKGAASHLFVEHAVSLVKEQGGEIGNVDITIICEAPKIGPHAAAMREKVAEILGISAAAVSVKATTTEKLGTTGDGMGIAAQALATVRINNG